MRREIGHKDAAGKDTASHIAHNIARTL